MNLEKRLDKEASYGTLYYDEMEKLITQGYAVKIIDRLHASNRDWYLPHFGVCSPSKPGKLRLVFDAAAKSVE